MENIENTDPLDSADQATLFRPKTLRLNLSEQSIELKLIQSIPIRLVKRYKFLPVFLIEKTLTIAIEDPDDLDTIDKIRAGTNYEIEPVYADIYDIEKHIDKYYGVISEVDEMLMNMDDSTFDSDKYLKTADTQTMYDIGEENIDDAPAVRIVNLVVRDAIVRGASDIHIEPAEKEILLRLRIDGKLIEVNKLPNAMYSSIVSRIKVIGEMDISESRIPQDGRIKAIYQGRRFDLRISVLPTVYGENIVIRIAGGETNITKITNVGFEDHDLDLIHACLSNNQGMFLATGPTGSGKTTTLYACLDYLNQISSNIITLEDPVEKELPLIRQVNVNDKVGLSFAAGLRSMLRQDPDIIMVGEIRDLETAQMAVRAALTGHIVLSTLHTNDCPSTIIRLVDIGVKPFLVASALTGVLAQRLVRKICPYCQEEYRPDPKTLQLLSLPYDHPYIRGKGCDQCRNIGYLGRIPVFELMILNRELRDAIAESATSDELKHLAIKNGMHSIAEDGKYKVLKNLTTPEEVLAVTTLQTDKR